MTTYPLNVSDIFQFEVRSSMTTIIASLPKLHFLPVAI